jgi:hypothetical protein
MRMKVLFVMFALASLQGCVTSDEPLLSENENYVDHSVAGTYLNGEMQIEIRLVGQKYVLSSRPERKTVVVELQKLDAEFYIAQVDTKKDFTYWLVRIAPNYFLISKIPCDSAMFADAGVKVGGDNSCVITSRDDLVAVAKIAAKQFIPRISNVFVKQNK